MKYLNRFLSFFKKESKEIKQFQNRIQYYFKNLYYLNEALTHKSVKSYEEGNYERLEFLGDSIIDHVVSYWLFTKYSKSDEGTLTKKRAALVNRDFLAMLGKKIKITEIINIDSGVNIKDEKVINNISADVYEALVGAIYLDGGYKSAKQFIKRTLCLSEYLATEDSNFKGKLIEYCHKYKLPTPIFDILDSHGPEHERTFTIKVSINNKQKWIGIGSSKKYAEQDAAKRAIFYLLGN